MKISFKKEIPAEVINWLWDNVGEGNISRNLGSSLLIVPGYNAYDWFYENSFEGKVVDGFNVYVPTITIKDEKLAALFLLKWK